MNVLSISWWALVPVVLVLLLVYWLVWRLIKWIDRRFFGGKEK